ncbi:hypothetical protein DE146DRAFT_739469 [Phaeosphaeria sp. MPI-PUGE-AT-0046c]|nr:hypothetical protein DE146DRAFT_739469 [Phaeosphaeria sp. MPI-PUGE-AT-0046c]
MMPEGLRYGIKPFKDSISLPLRLKVATFLKAQKRDHPDDPTLLQPPVKRGRGRPRKHPLINKGNNAPALMHKGVPFFSGEVSEPAWKVHRVGERRSKRIQELENRGIAGKYKEQKPANAKLIVSPCTTYSKYKLWDMQQTRILLAHDLTNMPPPHYGPFGDTLGFKSGNYSYEQNKRTYEAKIEIWEASELEVDVNDDTDVEEEVGHDAVVQIVQCKRWKPNYKKWRKDYKEWLNDRNE